MGSLEKGRILLRKNRFPSGLFMLGCDGYRHADLFTTATTVYNSYHFTNNSKVDASGLTEMVIVIRS